MSFLPKIRAELSLRRQADVLPTNPSTIEQVYTDLITNGFEPISKEDYFSDMVVDELFVRIAADNRPFAIIWVLGRKICGLLDSGAHRTVLGFGCRKLVKDLKLKILKF